MPLKQAEVNDAQSVLKGFVIPKPSLEWITKASIFSIAVQQIRTKRAKKFLDSFNGCSIDELTDPWFVEAHAKRKKMKDPDRYVAIMQYIDSYGHEKFVKDYLANPFEFRDEVVKEVKGVGHKTASMLYLCFGGTELMTLDVHCFRQLSGLGVEINPDYHVGRVRKSGATKGKIVKSIPSRTDYLRIECESLGLVGKNKLYRRFPEFGTGEKINAAFTTALFWWLGMQAEDKPSESPYQNKLFNMPADFRIFQ